MAESGVGGLRLRMINFHSTEVNISQTGSTYAPFGDASRCQCRDLQGAFILTITTKTNGAVYLMTRPRWFFNKTLSIYIEVEVVCLAIINTHCAFEGILGQRSRKCASFFAVGCSLLNYDGSGAGIKALYVEL